MKRPVRNRMRGVVGAGGEKPPATRLMLVVGLVRPHLGLGVNRELLWSDPYFLLLSAIVI